MSIARRFRIALSAVQELGPASLALYGLYRFGLATGHYRRVTPPKPYRSSLPPGFALQSFPTILSVPMRSQLRELLGGYAQNLVSEADEILQGQIHLFGGEPVPLVLQPPGPLRHWTACLDDALSGDVKLIWEPARLGFTFSLGRAFLFTGDERYAQAFWQLLETFLDRNPPNLGPNWASAQEVALRILAFTFAGQVFAGSLHTTTNRTQLLAAAVAAHAARIPATLPYARAQNNNHLLTEALGLYVCGVLLPEHPEAARWHDLGWRWLNDGLQTQITPEGGYAQHSANYHRLMLHAALFGEAAARSQGQYYPPQTLERLAAATRWLRDLQDPLSGHVPNLGHNDGANTLPLTSADFGDYRPVVQAAARAFLGAATLPPGPWDELSVWLGLPLKSSSEISSPLSTVQASAGIHRLASRKSWAGLRIVQFEVRPAHADQMHVDLWWQGQPILLDAGTYRYTAPAPWQNGLTCAAAHNTLTIDGQEPMERAGKFLWLHWDQARLIEENEREGTITAEHDGFLRLGVLHRRMVHCLGDETWQISDSLLPAGEPTGPHTAVLHYLLPNWPWQIHSNLLTLNAPSGQIRVKATVEQAGQIQSVQLVRAGQVLSGQPETLPILGWYSPTYNHKIPALSFRITASGSLPLVIKTHIELLS